MGSNQIHFGTFLLVALTLNACAEPPSEIIEGAQEAEQAAVTAGANEYAPAVFDSVEEARVALEAELAVQEGRWAIRRSYEQAEQLAESYRAASERATAAAAVAREEARNVATTLVTESRARLEEVSGMLLVAPVGKGSRADLAALRTDLEAAAAGVSSAEAALAAERYLEAQATATSAREIIDRVKLSVEQARSVVIS